MKKTIITLLAILCAMLANAQVNLQDYIKEIPDLPHDSCAVSRVGVKNYTQLVQSLIDKVNNEIKSLKKQSNTSAKTSGTVAQENAAKQMQQQYGLSDEDIKKLKDKKNMTPEEKKAIANKMMVQQTNMTVDEAKRLSKMSPEAKKAYYEAYSTEMMANAQANPQQQKTTNDNAKNNYQLMTDQQSIMNKVNATNQKIANLYATSEGDPNRQKMVDKIDNWHSKMMAKTGVDYGQGKELDSLARLIRNEQIKYCEKFTPKYRDALRQHLVYFKASLPDYEKMAEATDKLMKTQSGVSAPPESKDIVSLEALNGYLEKLKDVFQFKLYFPESQ